jgi:mannosyltransferase OCH1-like enzyme
MNTNMLLIRNKISSAWRFAYKKLHPLETDISIFYTAAPAKSGKIPNVVYQTWKKASLSSLHAHYLKKFRKLNSDYSFRFFDDTMMAEYMENAYNGHSVLDVFRAIRIPASRADIWRYCILYREGGVYCDIDSGLSIPLRVLLHDDPSEMISFENNYWSESLDTRVYSNGNIFYSKVPEKAKGNLDFPDNVVLNWLLCFEKESPILKKVIDMIVQHFDFYNGKKFTSIQQAVVHCTGPQVLTQAIWKWIMETGKRPVQFGIDFGGYGIFKLPGAGESYSSSPHYSTLSNTTITR